MPTEANRAKHPAGRPAAAAELVAEISKVVEAMMRQNGFKLVHKADIIKWLRALASVNNSPSAEYRRGYEAALNAVRIMVEAER